AFAAVAWGYNSPEALAGMRPAYLFTEPGAIARALADPIGRSYCPARAPGTTEAPAPLPNGS
ncbi:hypothetical protein ABTK62_21295, partial [Acinetobacter baumannii]